MMRISGMIVCIGLLVSDVAFAAPDSSIRPLARSTASQIDDVSKDRSNLRPRARPAVLETALASQLAQQFQRENDPTYDADPIEVMTARARAFATVSPQATGLSLKPSKRPGGVVRKAMAQRAARARGSVCGDPDIQGQSVGLVPGRLNGCGVQNGMAISSVSGVSLSQQAVMDCTTAKALKAWIKTGMKPAVGDLGGGVQQIKVAAHYACRPRNNQSGARISEHGKGRAIDISGFQLRDGKEITLLDGWDAKGTGPILRKMHDLACGVFGTVLGPEANRFHRDHFHFDTARYRKGSYCR